MQGEYRPDSQPAFRTTDCSTDFLQRMSRTSRPRQRRGVFGGRAAMENADVWTRTMLEDGLLPGSRAAGHRAGCRAPFNAITSLFLISQTPEPAGVRFGVLQLISQSKMSVPGTVTVVT